MIRVIRIKGTLSAAALVFFSTAASGAAQMRTPASVHPSAYAPPVTAPVGALSVPLLSASLSGSLRTASLPSLAAGIPSVSPRLAPKIDLFSYARLGPGSVRLALPGALSPLKPSNILAGSASQPAAVARDPILGGLTRHLNQAANFHGKPAARARSMIGNLFDGSAAKTAASVFAANPNAGLAKQFLIANQEHAEILAQIVREAEASRTGRKVLRRIEDLVKGRKRPIIVEFTLMQSAHAYVDWDTDVLRLSRSMLRKEPIKSAPVFIHELVHVIQRAHRLPYYAFELELEAWLHTLKVAQELGLNFKRGDFQASAQKKFKGEYQAFIDWLREQHQEGGTAMFSVLNGSHDAFLEFLEARQVDSDKRVDRIRKKLARRRATYAEMKRSRSLTDPLKNYRSEDIAPLERNLKKERAALQAMEKDLRSFKTADGAQRYERYRDWARRVRRMGRDFHRLYNAD